MGLEFESLSALEQELWNIAVSLSVTGSDLHLVVLRHKSLDYLFAKQNKGRLKASTFYEDDEKVTLEHVHRSSGWNVLVDDIGQDDIEYEMFQDDIEYEMFQVSGFSSLDQLVRATLKNIRHDVTVVNLAENPSMEITDKRYFEALVGFGERNGSKVRKFFRERRIVSGTYRIASINNFLLFAVLNPSAIKEFLETGNVPDGYFESHYYGIDVYCPNWLDYKAEKELFEFRVNLNREPNSSQTELMDRIKSVLEFTFRGIEDYVRAGGEDAILQKVFNCSADESEKIWEAFGLWRRSDDDFDKDIEEETWEMVRNWVKPDVVEVAMVSTEIDPSRGTYVWNSTKIDEYSETFDEWRRINFEKVEPGAYLLRLEQQNREMKKSASSLNKSHCFDIPLEELDYSVRTYNCLKRQGVNTLGDVLALSEPELLEIKNLGAKGVLEIPEMISAMGLGHLVGASSWPFDEK
jgi:hypothetical protein